MERFAPRRARQVLAAGVVGAATVTLVIALTRPPLRISVPAATARPSPSADVTPPPSLSPSATPAVSSTVKTRGPLVLYYVPPSSGDVIQLSARTYAGKAAGSLVIPYSDSGYSIAPDGSKVLDGNEIISVTGFALGRIAWTSPEFPMWADDSAHLCGVTHATDAPAKLVVADSTGSSRVVTDVASPAVDAAWTVIACSFSADRAVLLGQTDASETIVTIRLSTGARLGTRTFATGPSWGGTVATHDGGIVAVNEASGIVIRDTSTWALRARIVRWGSQAGFPLIGAGIVFSWDGSRILADGGGAGGAEHPMWIVNWAHDRNVLTSATSPDVFAGAVGVIVPLVVGSEFLIPSGIGPTYLLEDSGRLDQFTG